MANPSSIQGLLKTNVPPYQDGINKAAFPAFALAAEASFGAQPAGAASRRQVASFPCSRTGSTLCAQKWLRPFLRHRSGRGYEPFNKLRACFFETPRGL